MPRGRQINDGLLPLSAPQLDFAHATDSFGPRLSVSIKWRFPIILVWFDSWLKHGRPVRAATLGNRKFGGHRFLFSPTNIRVSATLRLFGNNFFFQPTFFFFLLLSTYYLF